MKTLNMISDRLNKVCGWFLIVCFTVMTVAYFGQVVLRFMGTGFHWTEELTRYTNIAMVMVGSAVLAGKNRHINVSALETFAPPKFSKWIIRLQQVITIIFFGASIFIGLNMMELAGTQVSTNMRVPMKLVYSIFPVAFSILVFQTFVFLLNSIFTGQEKGEA